MIHRVPLIVSPRNGFIRTVGAPSLGTITDLAAIPGNGQIALSWTPAAHATSHQPQYRAQGSGAWLSFGSPLSGTASGATVLGLTPGTPYEFRVVASDGVSQTFSNVVTATPVGGGGGGAVVLSGSGFGTRSSQTPLFFQTFEALPVDTSALSAGFDRANGGYEGAAVRDTRSHSGTRSLHVRYTANEYPTVSKSIPGGLTLYTAAWVYWERSGTATHNHIFKVFRGGTGQVYHGNPKYYSTLRPNAATGNIGSGGDTGINNGATLYDQVDDVGSVFPQRAQWTFVEVKYVLSTPGVANGMFRIYYNGTLVGRKDNAVTRASGVTAELAWACPWMNGVDQGSDRCIYDLYEDEVLIDTTFARVIATDAANYSTSTRYAPQAPSSWSNSEIVIEAPNWSNLMPGSTAYFHVWDADDSYIGSFARSVPGG